MKTVYCVRTYIGPAGHQEPGALRQFATYDDAVSAGRALIGRAAGVIVFMISGEPDFDWWGEPVVIERHGTVVVPGQWAEARQ